MEKLLAAGGCWRRGNQFSLAMWPLLGCHAPEDDPTLMCSRVAVRFSDCFGVGFKKEEVMKLGGAY